VGRSAHRSVLFPTSSVWVSIEHMSTENLDPAHALDDELYRQMFDRRTLLLGEPLEDRNSNRLCNAILLLAADDPRADIRLLINSPGGSVPGMLAIRDCMRSVGNDVSTINLGMAYSAGQFLLSSGAKGKRYARLQLKITSGRFTANAAWLVLACIAFNLTRAAGTIAAGALTRATTGTIRRTLINVPSRVSCTANTLTLHLPTNWPWQQGWDVLFTRVCGPPPKWAC